MASDRVEDWGNPVRDWILEQTRRHGHCTHVFTKLPFYATTYSVLNVQTGETVSDGHSLGVAKARCNALNAKELVDG